MRDAGVRDQNRMRSDRFVTLDGHLEAGQIRFAARRGELLEFSIESWARAGDRLSNLLYEHLRTAWRTRRSTRHVGTTRAEDDGVATASHEGRWRPSGAVDVCAGQSSGPSGGPQLT